MFRKYRKSKKPSSEGLVVFEILRSENFHAVGIDQNLGCFVSEYFLFSLAPSVVCKFASSFIGSGIFGFVYSVFLLIMISVLICFG